MTRRGDEVQVPAGPAADAASHSVHLRSLMSLKIVEDHVDLQVPRGT